MKYLIITLLLLAACAPKTEREVVIDTATLEQLADLNAQVAELNRQVLALTEELANQSKQPSVDVIYRYESEITSLEEQLAAEKDKVDYLEGLLESGNGKPGHGKGRN